MPKKILGGSTPAQYAKKLAIKAVAMAENSKALCYFQQSLYDQAFTRTVDGYSFFPDVKFHDSQDAQRYLLDFWVIPEDGKLQVQEVRSYDEPLESDGKWTTGRVNPFPGGHY